jgi:hypothetical protein
LAGFYVNYTVPVNELRVFLCQKVALLHIWTPENYSAVMKGSFEKHCTHAGHTHADRTLRAVHVCQGVQAPFPLTHFF